jgi:sodium/potassium-transporting ATPase subunit alpha
MVTGDYALTAAAIATQIGIFTVSQYDTLETMKIKHKEGETSYDNSALLLTGTDLEMIAPEDWRIITQYSEIVFARTTPQQKLRTVKEFQHDKYIVGVTGDGVNDAPALKSADIGIAMGGGSEVAMDAAQLILLDNNFASIICAIENGRLVFDNLKKVILYLLPGGCMGELFPVLINVLLGAPQNLSSFEMLVICLFTDICPCLSLMMEKPEYDLMKKPPRKRSDHLVDWKFLIQTYLFMGAMISFFAQCDFFWYFQWYVNFTPGMILMSFTSWGDGWEGLTAQQLNEFLYQGQTCVFVGLVFMQIFGNLWSTRTRTKSYFQQRPWSKNTRNLYIYAADCVSTCILMIIVWVPFFNQIFQTRPPPVGFFFLPFAFCIFIFAMDELRKFLTRMNVLCFPKCGW